MAIIIEHSKRKSEILEKSLDVFVEEGFKNATFQKIAGRCGITRTTLYTYFKDKRDVFMGSIRQLTKTIETKLKVIAVSPELSCMEKLRSTMYLIIDNCLANRKLCIVLLDYLVELQKSGKNPNERVKRRVLRLRHILSSIIIEGQKCGEFHRTNVKDTDELFYALVEAAIFRLAVLAIRETKDIRTAIDAAVGNLAVDNLKELK
ncbi:MAG: TetR/AcrR family transcriptional regulator [Spirochaetaceae bacterium]|jgi:AcrR family transcriptional regulator|nr:TetR/AcrR family transcriptional regulator [Spirochaetaceae bacterium]